MDRAIAKIYDKFEISALPNFSVGRITGNSDTNVVKKGAFTFPYSCLGCDWKHPLRPVGVDAWLSMHSLSLPRTGLAPSALQHQLPKHVLGTSHVIQPSPSEWPAVSGPLLPFPRVTFDPGQVPQLLPNVTTFP